VNRYAALLEGVAENAGENYNLQMFGRDIAKACCFSAAYNSGTCESKDAAGNVPVKVVMAPFKEAIANASCLVERLAASRAYSRARKAEVKSRLERDFVANALRAPREDKQKDKTIRPIFVTSADGSMVPSFDADVWVSEFRKLYCELFQDPANSVQIQRERLRSLEREANKEPRIVVPLWMVYEVLSQSGRKRNKAVGSDSISWGALGMLPLRCIELLRRLIEARLKNCKHHNSLVQNLKPLV
jgi:hypothetical protein